MATVSTQEASSPRSIGDRLSDWWLRALPPMNGPLRIAYYVLLFIALSSMPEEENPLAAPERIAKVPTVLYMPHGIIAALGLTPHLSVLSVVRAITVVAWFIAAIGLFWRASAIITALGFFFLYGFNAAYELNHGAMLPGYTLLFLALFSACDDRWTVDTHIAKRWPRYWFRPPSPDSISRTGFARALVTIGAIHGLFSAGISKMFDAGPSWATGATIEGMLHTTSVTRLPLLRDFLFRHPFLIRGTAVFTLMVELGAPLALISRRARHAYAVCASSLHIGIFALMLPNYLPYVTTYLSMLIDWESVWRFLKRKPAPVVEVTRSRDLRWPRYVGTAFALVTLFVALFQVEYWPLGHMTMYSTYVSSTRVGDYPKDKLGDPEVVHRIATGCARGVDGPWLGYCKFRYPIEIALRSGFRLAGDSGCNIPVSRKELPGGSISWAQAMSVAFIYDIAQKPPGKIEEIPGHETILHDFMREMIPYVQVKAATNPACTRLEGTFRLDRGLVVVATVPLTPASNRNGAGWFASVP